MSTRGPKYYKDIGIEVKESIDFSRVLSGESTDLTKEFIYPKPTPLDYVAVRVSVVSKVRAARDYVFRRYRKDCQFPYGKNIFDCLIGKLGVIALNSCTHPIIYELKRVVEIKEKTVNSPYYCIFCEKEEQWSRNVELFDKDSRGLVVRFFHRFAGIYELRDLFPVKSAIFYGAIYTSGLYSMKMFMDFPDWMENALLTGMGAFFALHDRYINEFFSEQEKYLKADEFAEELILSYIKEYEQSSIDSIIGYFGNILPVSKVMDTLSKLVRTYRVVKVGEYVYTIRELTPKSTKDGEAELEET